MKVRAVRELYSVWLLKEVRRSLLLTIHIAHSQQDTWRLVLRLSLVQFRSQTSANGRFILLYRQGFKTHSPNPFLLAKLSVALLDVVISRCCD